VRVLTWNLNWATCRSHRGMLLREIVEELSPDLSIFTEATIPWLDALGGHLALADQNYGYASDPNRRKVALWSSNPIKAIDNLGSSNLPTGRFVQEITHGLTVAGLCIPWNDAHVRTGRKDKARWEEHSSYISGLSSLSSLRLPKLIVGGDFNQRNPRHRQPENVFDPLIDTFRHLNWTSEGIFPPLRKRSIDHILTSPDLVAGRAISISSEADGTTLSDHFGVYCDVEV
jgi:endonuclease/exonuclease/phosphatase family metal-dependent hydrolase